MMSYILIALTAGAVGGVCAIVGLFKMADYIARKSDD